MKLNQALVLSILVLYLCYEVTTASNLVGSGTTCDKDSVCTVENSYCGYYESCKKCVCNTNYVYASVDSTDKCLQGGVKLDSSCEDVAQCSGSNVECSGDPKKCTCMTGYVAVSGACVKPNSEGATCDAGVGCDGAFFCNSSTCTACTATDCSTCTADAAACDACADGKYVDGSSNCVACTASDCKTCSADPAACDACATGKYIDGSSNCVDEIAYNAACSAGQQCASSGLQLECNTNCVCAASYTWHTAWELCLADGATSGLAADAECTTDLTNVKTYLASTNDNTLKVCGTGLTCVPGCGAESAKSYCAKAIAGSAGRIVTNVAVIVASLTMSTAMFL